MPGCPEECRPRPCRGAVLQIDRRLWHSRPRLCFPPQAEKECRAALDHTRGRVCHKAGTVSPPTLKFLFFPASEQGRRGTALNRRTQRSGGRRAAGARGMTRAGREPSGFGQRPARGVALDPRSRPERRGHRPAALGPRAHCSFAASAAADSFDSFSHGQRAAGAPTRPRSRYSGLKRRARTRTSVLSH